MDIFKIIVMNRFSKIAGLLFLIVLSSGCVYYNTFYLARKSFNEAENRRKDSKGSRQNINKGQYNKAIEKSDKVLEKYPNSKWYDDALYVNGVSHYYTKNYRRAEKRFRELLAEFPEFEYIKETRIYLAKAKLKLGDEAEAMTLFEKMFAESEEKSVKGDAAMSLGEYYFENKDYEKSRIYFQSVVDSLGVENDKLIAQGRIADGYFTRFKYKNALASYLLILELDPGLDETYQATYRAGECSYFINDIEQGMEYFGQLAENQDYFDSLGQVKLQLALGYELDGDILFAEEIYQEVTVESSDNAAGAAANYNLGLIYQFDYEDYTKAKSYYDKAKNRRAEKSIYQDALQRSSDIGKLEQFLNRDVLDTSITLDGIDSAATIQFLLAELYFFKLDKPDSAYQEFEYILLNFPESYLAPKSLIAMAALQRDFYKDTLAYDSILRKVLSDYARSDFAPEAINLLGLSGTAIDTGYAKYYFHKAEDFAFEQNNIDSAKYYYNLIADSFPRSNLNVQARYAAIWMDEEFASLGDSSLYFAYVDFVDSFPNTIFGKEADQKLLMAEGKAKKPIDRVFDEEPYNETNNNQQADTSATPASQQDEETVKYQEDLNFIDPNGNIIRETKEGPIRTEREFRYPPAAYLTNFYGNLTFQIKINAFGEIDDIRLMTPTESPELNEEAEKVLESSRFDTGWMEPEEYDTWFVYKFRVDRPEGMR